jgi:non-canonical purine NTP pyrophosphatase (RdgB/HAM1 family)
MKKSLVFVTSNDNKAKEASEFLGVAIKRVKIDLDEIQSLDLTKVINHKARQAYAKVKRPVLVEDVSLELKAWKGFPGPFVKWLGETLGFLNLPAVLAGQDKGVTWTAMWGYFDGKKLYTFSASEEGVIATSPRGDSGFGFDVIFIPNGFTKTVAEMGIEIKMQQSARIQAMRKLKIFLDKFKK